MITSLSNAKIKNVVNLVQKSKVRNEQDSFVVEGVKMFLEAPIELVREVYVSQTYEQSLIHSTEPEKQEILGKLQKCGYETVSDECFQKMSDTLTPQGVLCVLKKLHYDLTNILQKTDTGSLFVFLENLQDPGNLGTIMRTSEGAGVHAVIMTKKTVDIYNPKTIRATMGSIYRVPFIYIEETRQTIELLKENKVRVYAAHLKGTTYYDGQDYTGSTAFLIGNEGNGLTEETAVMADTYIKIPMHGKLESLNAAIATSLLIYEAERQRRN
ncbi:MAG: RNA methyltransferase [Lachnospiraceae bacterium]|nr:RNA methyltransferase [Lachnospiraceae bacterium]